MPGWLFMYNKSMNWFVTNYRCENAHAPNPEENARQK